MAGYLLNGHTSRHLHAFHAYMRENVMRVTGSSWGKEPFCYEGRGFFIKENVFVTCRHVMTTAPFVLKGMYGVDYSSEEEGGASVLPAVAPQNNDLTFICFDDAVLEPAPLAEKAPVIGDILYAVETDASRKILKGYVTHTNMTIACSNSQITAHVQQVGGLVGRRGRSGSPVFNDEGEIAGMFLAKDGDYGYIHDIDVIRRAMKATVGIL